MADDRFDRLTRVLASPHSRRSLLGLILGSTGGAASRAPAALAKPDDKVTVCILDVTAFAYNPKLLPAPAAEAQVTSGKAVYPIVTSDDFCAEPCGPSCQRCPQRLPSHTCTKCVNGECTCPDSEAGAISFSGGQEGTAPLVGTSYQIFNYDDTTQTIGGTALSGVQAVTDATTGIVVFGPFPGDAPVCVKEVATPPGYSLIGHDFACLHLGCGHQFLWDFRHEP